MGAGLSHRAVALLMLREREAKWRGGGGRCDVEIQAQSCFSSGGSLGATERCYNQLPHHNTDVW